MEDSFSQLTDDMLIRILSFAPIKDAVATSILSKRWRFLWTLLTRLNFEDRFVEDCILSSDFIFGFLLLHKSPVVETFHLTRRRSQCSALQIESWVRFAVDRFVRDLKIYFAYATDHCRIRLPSALFRCETLETLELKRVILSEVPSRVSLPSLKTLRLIFLKYEDEESFVRLVSSSPVLEDLDVKNSSKDSNGKTFTINVPSLRSLTVHHTMEDADTNDNVFVIHSHSLNHLDVIEECDILEDCVNFNIIGDFPKVVEASLDIDSRNILESLTFVKRLSLSLYYGAQYPIRTIFFQLVCLEFHRFSENWANLLVCMLQHSPILQILKFEDDHPGCWDPDEGYWIPPSSAPECLFYHLKTFDCKDIEGTPRQKEVAIYILKNARQLVTATVSQHVFEELENATRGSRSCELTMG